MNPRQRRGVILLAAAAVGAIAVFVWVAGYVSDVRSQVGPMATVLRLTRDVRATEAFEPDWVEPAHVPERWAPATAITDAAAVAGLVAGTDLRRGSVLQDGMLVTPPRLQPGEREVAILVDAETGVAGKIGPGNRVDIYATFDGAEGQPPTSTVIITDALIIDVGVPAAQADIEENGAFAEGKVVPVTFALSVQESLVLTYAESFATKLRLALVRAGERSFIPADQHTFVGAGPAAE